MDRRLTYCYHAIFNSEDTEVLWRKLLKQRERIVEHMIKQVSRKEQSHDYSSAFAVRHLFAGKPKQILCKSTFERHSCCVLVGSVSVGEKYVISSSFLT